MFERMRNVATEVLARTRGRSKKRNLVAELNVQQAVKEIKTETKWVIDQEFAAERKSTKRLRQIRKG